MVEENQKKKTVLILAGIDKKWVQSENGRWVDEATLYVEPGSDTQDEILENDQASKRRWWKFW